MGPYYRFQFGQFKAPFSLQQLTSSGRQQFVDRAITDGKYTPGRDMGAMVSGAFSGHRIGYAAGVFNGSGESLTQTNQAPLVAARFFADPLRAYSLAEGAADGGRPALHLGVGVRTGKQDSRAHDRRRRPERRQPDCRERRVRVQVVAVLLDRGVLLDDRGAAEPGRLRPPGPTSRRTASTSRPA